MKEDEKKDGKEVQWHAGGVNGFHVVAKRFDNQRIEEKHSTSKLRKIAMSVFLLLKN